MLLVCRTILHVVTSRQERVSPLIAASKVGHPVIVELLVFAGARVNDADKVRTPSCSRLESPRILGREHGADVCRAIRKHPHRASPRLRWRRPRGD